MTVSKMLGATMAAGALAAGGAAAGIAGAAAAPATQSTTSTGSSGTTSAPSSTTTSRSTTPKAQREGEGSSTSGRRPCPHMHGGARSGGGESRSGAAYLGPPAVSYQ